MQCDATMFVTGALDRVKPIYGIVVKPIQGCCNRLYADRGYAGMMTVAVC